MEVIRHNHEVEEFEFRIFRGEVLPIGLDLLPELVKNDSIPDNRA